MKNKTSQTKKKLRFSANEIHHIPTKEEIKSMEKMGIKMELVRSKAHELINDMGDLMLPGVKPEIKKLIRQVDIVLKRSRTGGRTKRRR